VLAVGNFALTVVLLQKFAEMAAKLLPQWEIIDYASDGKKDTPSGTARELAARLARIRSSKLTVPLDETQGLVEARGARRTIDDAPLHATTLSVIATNVSVTKTDLTKLAMMANTGCARAINPYHTQGDGDQVLAVSTGLVTRDVSLTALGAVASEVVADAIGRAVRAATTIPGWVAVRDLQ